MAERQRSRTLQWTLRATLVAIAILSAWVLRTDLTRPTRDPSPAAVSPANGCSDEHGAAPGMGPPCHDGQTLLPLAVPAAGAYIPHTVTGEVDGTDLTVRSRPAPHVKPRPA